MENFTIEKIVIFDQIFLFYSYTGTFIKDIQTSGEASSPAPTLFFGGIFCLSKSGSGIRSGSETLGTGAVVLRSLHPGHLVSTVGYPFDHIFYKYT
jgi:hypothetical protein